SHHSPRPAFHGHAGQRNQRARAGRAAARDPRSDDGLEAHTARTSAALAAVRRERVAPYARAFSLRNGSNTVIPLHTRATTPPELPPQRQIEVTNRRNSVSVSC